MGTAVLDFHFRLCLPGCVICTRAYRYLSHKKRANLIKDPPFGNLLTGRLYYYTTAAVKIPMSVAVTVALDIVAVTLPAPFNALMAVCNVPPEINVPRESVLTV